ncbi:DUF177 domain-containing protein [Paraflavitalea sp. CAU 1676]|uniref:YceD family protein n=1 Tax=Paraflavitalea sp. CAU 1676 TaxID=3032598 RepID=UPI0023D98E07|nr:DUF177 domain-containing protein [Paraflavitalea sp. CAU 1676]MDF2191935.1 DUF177 domain-containing protein [Paraflavitalea sp. CAU 1676]
MSRRNFDIAFVGLKPGIHEFEYPIDDKFFVEYQEQDFKNCKAQVKLTLDKKTGFMLLKFEIGGQLEVICDRCGNNLPLQLWDDFNVVVKMVEDPEVMNEQEEDPDVHYISRGESHLHIADWIYEFINLSIPMQRMCTEDEMGGPHCNKEVLAMLKNMDVQGETAPNPQWKGLEKFKDLEDN